MKFDHNEEYTNESLYAYDISNKIIFIGDVLQDKNGLGPGYFCLGCKKKMEAVLPKKKISKYFRHHVTKGSKNNCTYSHETHRHFLSKSYLKELNKIKVPPLYKYPDSDDDPIYQIREADFVKAHSVILEKAIFEDENGKVQLVSKDKVDEKYLYFIPDAILLNEKNEPILLVEFVATHKPDQKKLMKLKRLGIDAIQVYVPKSSPEEIKRNLLISKNTKWLFNYEEQKTVYTQISAEDSRRIYDVDELQRSFFEEGYKCRSAQLGELIRSIEKILESESYRTIEQNIESEIRRITLASERAESELEELREKHSRSGIERYQEQRERVEVSEKEFQSKVSRLEQRYRSKRSRVEREIRVIEEETREVVSAIEAQSNIDEAIEREQKTEKEIRQKTEGLSNKIGELQQKLGRESEQLRESYEQEEERLEEEFRRDSERKEQDIKELREKTESIPETFERLRKDIESKIAGFRTEEAAVIERFRLMEKRIESESSRTITKRREENERIRKERLEKFDNGDIREALANPYSSKRIPELEEHAELYSNRLKLIRKIEKED
ncbi:hypothetical protein CW751_08070 [Brumimicrobium salinarum]|uniref:Uncharacterized protein n=1 Tax=Brumimicrobium salinarum TaxID=2058658 RepID=A0A2I0R2C0_9FLAO|nr:hypothetical protein [Brumimicrobium salinarum]PKR80717.1 hypothetical protein CW751_08070 [Brumimicrobium salinarum]